MSRSPLTAGERTELLRRIRQALEAWLDRREVPDVAGPELPAALLLPAGAFVSLHRHGHLRGCIGTFEADRPLASTAVEMGIAASRDPRFPPLRLSELRECELEVSVLSPRLPVNSPGEIEVGRHGVELSLGRNRGVFLPQVATEQGWDREQLLDHLSQKAGLPFGAWRQLPVRLEVFTAEVFSE